MPANWVDEIKMLRMAGEHAAAIHFRATELRNRATPFGVDWVVGRVKGMRDSYFEAIAPIVARPSVDVNADAAAFFSGMPVDTHGAFSTLRDELVAFNSAFEPAFNSVSNPLTYTGGGGFAWAQLPGNALTSLHDELDAVIAAAVPFT